MFSKNKKGQMSLEMIIGLVILLVVATVVVTMFLNVFENPSEGQSAISRNQIEQKCESSCQEWRTASGARADSAALSYCTQTHTFDSNGNNKKDDLITNGYNSYCEDGVHCFNLHTCDSSGTGGRTLDAETCREILCNYFSDSSNIQEDDTGAEDTDTIVRNSMQTGSCDLGDIQVGGTTVQTWYTSNFGENVEDVCEN